MLNLANGLDTHDIPVERLIQQYPPPVQHVICFRASYIFYFNACLVKYLHAQTVITNIIYFGKF